ncbi:MAG: WbqC family protein [Bacteroidota bacterium]
MDILLPVAYLPPLSYCARLLRHENVYIELYEHFPKQTWRNRCSIYSPNGIQHLVVPISGRKDKMIVKDVRLSNERDWQTLHWRSLEAAYRSSPFFEYYEDELRPHFEKKHEFLVDLDMELLGTLLGLLKREQKFTCTEKFEKDPGVNDGRHLLDKKAVAAAALPRYSQVFENKHGFLSNLSVVDLLFNQGNASADYLRELSA